MMSGEHAAIRLNMRGITGATPQHESLCMWVVTLHHNTTEGSCTYCSKFGKTAREVQGMDSYV